MDRSFLSSLLNDEIVAVYPLHGGDINEVFHVQTLSAAFAVKVNDSTLYADMFEKEARGLNSLKPSGFRIPEDKLTAENEGKAYLVMEYIASGMSDNKTMVKAGQNLAEMHLKLTDAYFGFPEDNYIGTLIQSNTRTKTWHELFVQFRIQPLLKKALDEKGIRFSGINETTMEKYLDQHFPVYAPSLVHGDLWAGNMFADSQGNPVLIDPAVYYGIPEMDLGMTLLFGGFSTDFYNSYLEYNPLEGNWRDRAELCNLYPLLVHVNLFGSGYSDQVQRIINRFFS